MLKRTQRRNWLLVPLLVMTTAFAVVVPQVVIAQDSAVENKEAVATTSSDDANAESELKQQSAIAGLLVLALLCVVFLTLIICVVLWARRMRLMTAKPLPDQHPGDPLWYLRKPADDDQNPESSAVSGTGSSGTE
ncbi:MAG: hypothetical protein ACYTGL_25520 [Planctomycetota bacterium]